VEKRKKRYRSRRVLDRLNPAYEAFAGYPILAALSIRPLATAEVSRALVLSRSATRDRLHALEKAGHIVQRMLYRKWVLRSRLVAEVPQVGDAYKALQEAQEPVSDLRQLAASKAAAIPDSEAPEGAQRVATIFNVPVQVKKLGWARINVETKCVACPNYSRLRYGATPVCVNCANSWRENV